MKLDNYFEILSDTDIRIQGTRIGIETVLLDYLELGLFPESIALRYPTLSIEQVYATITFYWHNQAEIDAYLVAWKEHGRQMRRQQAEKPPESIQRLRSVIAQQRMQPIDQIDAAIA